MVDVSSAEEQEPDVDVENYSDEEMEWVNRVPSKSSGAFIENKDCKTPEKRQRTPLQSMENSPILIVVDSDDDEFSDINYWP